jgi:predicted nuclease of predicted toxin-antitoxin system
LRFVCDQDVDARVAAALRRQCHEAWTASDAGLSRGSDDSLTVYAYDHDAALITHDIEFSRRRRRNVVGWHVFLRCNEWDGPAVILDHLDDLLLIFERKRDAWVKLSVGVAPEWSFDWK